MAMIRYKVIVAYDGSNYQGWQKQEDATTIQGEIEAVLSQIHQADTAIVGSGRTDSKVHALAQVFHFDTPSKMSGEQFKCSLNRMLSHRIRIRSVEEVDISFHARFSAVSKRYDYVVSYDILNPFIQHYKAREVERLDVEAMKKAASIFVGTHDFTSFTSSKVHPDKSRVKTVTNVAVIEEDLGIRIIFEGNGFLRYMVRMLSQTLIEVGKHNITYAAVKEMLELRDKNACRYKATACGLYLVRVVY